MWGIRGLVRCLIEHRYIIGDPGSAILAVKLCSRHESVSINEAFVDKGAEGHSFFLCRDFIIEINGHSIQILPYGADQQTH